ncbi:DUF4031 domain-containing protein [Verrucosispora sp. WMMD1129]|uniref:DUF4031 domain-containing protein n=1 Tax=Verrucosispora sp. WMMD1129 TaxID=3016093 RepID=UPI00249A9FBC|nr:DUF4031 domain-containing protein [Verrucosispora sp. WMMD1129]WFE46171.1 DUF4031 domain-containing protein [Verrucosispora sp. WMMD1129]
MIYVDRPAWPGRGRLWSHLISDVALAELHVFAEMLGAPGRGFDRDHYDIPAERFPMAVWLGAQVVPSRDIVRLLRAANLRRPKHLSRPTRPSRPPLPPTAPAADHAGVVRIKADEASITPAVTA